MKAKFLIGDISLINSFLSENSYLVVRSFKICYEKSDVNIGVYLQEDLSNVLKYKFEMVIGRSLDPLCYCGEIVDWQIFSFRQNVGFVFLFSGNDIKEMGRMKDVAVITATSFIREQKVLSDGGSDNRDVQDNIVSEVESGSDVLFEGESKKKIRKKNVRVDEVAVDLSSKIVI